ncbi:MAG: AMP nucleosidase [Hyphomicrobiales bacterium]|nr:AMP nucleosidase [Hyphomicrobiales bacterium]
MKNNKNKHGSELPVALPDYSEPGFYDNTGKAVDALCKLYDTGTGFLREKFRLIMGGKPITRRYRAFYPKIRVITSSYAKVDSRLAFGHLAGPGTYETTITRPDLFDYYLRKQIGLLIDNHGVQIEVGLSDVPIPLHFAFPEGQHIDGAIEDNFARPLRDVFDTPDLSVTDDKIANGEYDDDSNDVQPLAPFTAARIDYSLHRLAHYTATSPAHFQNYILFTNYQFYMDEFLEFAKQAVSDPASGYDAFIEGGNVMTLSGDKKPSSGVPLGRQPQMPTYHLTRSDKAGITIINIGVGPSNAKTITDHVAVLRPHTWLMLGHCAGLRNSQSLGDYVLAHGYVREDNVLDEDLPVWIPIPPLAEVQIALEQAVAEVTGLKEYTLKKIMRTGTVATIDNRNWELRDQAGPIKRLSQSRAIGLDMESATIAANGFRFRVPYGTLLCISDKPLHGELKLPGMATEFYTRQVSQHLKIGILALEKVREMPSERLHSRKLRAFNETAFQ